jgi:hypothetical protein
MVSAPAAAGVLCYVETRVKTRVGVAGIDGVTRSEKTIKCRSQIAHKPAATRKKAESGKKAPKGENDE